MNECYMTPFQRQDGNSLAPWEPVPRCVSRSCVVKVPQGCLHGENGRASSTSAMKTWRSGLLEKVLLVSLCENEGIRKESFPIIYSCR